MKNQEKIDELLATSEFIAEEVSGIRTDIQKLDDILIKQLENFRADMKLKSVETRSQVREIRFLLFVTILILGCIAFFKS